MTTIVSFLFPTVRSGKVEPLSAAVGVGVADAQIVQGRYLHASSHEKGAYDELRIDRLASGAAPAGTVLQADGVGGVQFSQQVATSHPLSISQSLCGKRIRFRVPTRVAEFAFPLQSSSSSQFSALVVARTSTSSAAAPIWHWRLFDRATQTQLASGTGSTPQTFSAVLQPGAYQEIELHVWLDATSLQNEFIVAESLLINSI